MINDIYYSSSVLNIPVNSDLAIVKQAYKEKVMLYHPDKGGTNDQFIEVNKAYHFLLDWHKWNKEIESFYGKPPQTTKSGIKSSNTNNRNNRSLNTWKNETKLNDNTKDKNKEDNETCKTVQYTQDQGKELNIIKEAFNTSTRESENQKTKSEDIDDNVKRSPPKKGKTKDITYKIEISWEEAFNGKTKTITWKRNRLCTGCKAVSTAVQGWCKECNGTQIKMTSKNVDLILKPGTYTSCKIILKKESEEYPGYDPGDVIFEVNVREDKVFKRDGNDWFINYDLSLLDDLLGSVKQIPYFNNEKITMELNEILHTGSVKTIKNKGMPWYEDATKFGDLKVVFNIVYPKSIVMDEGKRNFLKIALGKDVNKQSLGVTNKNKEDDKVNKTKNTIRSGELERKPGKWKRGLH